MKTRPTVFITGATGALGSYLTKLLLDDGYCVFVLARNSENSSAEQRVLRALETWGPAQTNNNYSRLTVLEGDITKKYLGLTNSALNILRNETESIFHCAAEVEFNLPLEKLRNINVLGTQNVVDLFVDFKTKGNSKSFNYISTIFVSGNHKGFFSEQEFDLGQGFNNNYEISKFETEKLMRKYKEGGVAIRIFRPSILVGEYSAGIMPEFRMFYQALYLFNLELTDKMPLNTKTFLNLMPVDLAAKAIVALYESDINNDFVFHIASSDNFSITHVVDVASDLLNFIKPRYVGVGEYDTSQLRKFERELFDSYIPYFNLPTVFKSERTQSQLKQHGFEYPSINDDFLNRILQFCMAKKYLRRKRR